MSGRIEAETTQNDNEITLRVTAEVPGQAANQMRLPVDKGPYVAVVNYQETEERDYTSASDSWTNRVQKGQVAQAVASNGAWVLTGQATNETELDGCHVSARAA